MSKETESAANESKGRRTVKLPRDISRMMKRTAILRDKRKVGEYADPVLRVFGEMLMKKHGVGGIPRVFIAPEGEVTTINVSPAVANLVGQVAGWNRVAIEALLNDQHLRDKVEADYRQAIGTAVAEENKKAPAPTVPLSPISEHAFILPFAGPVAAGTPIEVFENPHEVINLAQELGGEGRFVFVVRGSSMEEERIFDGDSVIVQRDPEPTKGDVVIAQVGGALTLKKLAARTEKETRLVSRDGKRTPIILDEGRGDHILGKYVGMYRKAR